MIKLNKDLVKVTFTQVLLKSNHISNLSDFIRVEEKLLECELFTKAS